MPSFTPDRATVDNQPVCRTLSNGALLLQDDIRTPLQEQLELGKGEKAIGISIDTRTCVPSLIVPGDLVSFQIPVAAGPTKAPPRAAENANGQENGQLNPIPAAAAVSSGATRTVGPFKVLSLGNRLSRAGSHAQAPNCRRRRKPSWKSASSSSPTASCRTTLNSSMTRPCRTPWGC